MICRFGQGRGPKGTIGLEECPRPKRPEHGGRLDKSSPPLAFDSHALSWWTADYHWVPLKGLETRSLHSGKPLISWPM